MGDVTALTPWHLVKRTLQESHLSQSARERPQFGSKTDTHARPPSHAKHETQTGRHLFRPARAGFRSGTAVGRAGDAFGDHKGESIEKPTVLLGFFEGRTERAGLGLGLGGGWGLQTVS